MVLHLTKTQRLLGEISYITKVKRSPIIQEFALCVVTVYDEHVSLKVKFKDGICIELHLKLRFESHFVTLLGQDSFESDCPERKFQTITSLKSV